MEKLYRFIDKNSMCLKEVNCVYSKQVSEILFFKDNNYNIIWTNKKDHLLKKYDLTENELYNKPCYKLFCNKDEPTPQCPLAKAKKSSKEEEAEIKLPNNNIFISRALPIKNDNDQLCGFIQSINNITDEKKLKQELKSKNLKIDLFTNLSHELRTPLNLMHSSLQIIEMHLNKLNTTNEKKSKFLKYFNLIRQNNYRLMKLVNNIMDLQKMDSGNYKIDYKEEDIVKCIKDITLSSSEYAKNQGKNINFNSDIEHKIIPFDPYEIERVILNLLSNAFKFTDSGDTITVNIKDGEKYIHIIVEDTGIGITEEQHEKIFDKFSRVNDTFYRKSEGSGLGLSIVKFIIEVHGGEITIKSQKNKGSKFIIKLPVKQKESSKEVNKTRKVNSTIDRLDIEYSDIYM